MQLRLGSDKEIKLNGSPFKTEKIAQLYKRLIIDMFKKMGIVNIPEIYIRQISISDLTRLISIHSNEGYVLTLVKEEEKKRKRSLM